MDRYIKPKFPCTNKALKCSNPQCSNITRYHLPGPEFILPTACPDCGKKMKIVRCNCVQYEEKPRQKKWRDPEEITE